MYKIFNIEMMDPYYMVRSEIHKRRPTYGIFMIIWTLFMASLAGFFGYYTYNIETKCQCLVNGTETAPIIPIPFGITESPNVVDVST